MNKAQRQAMDTFWSRLNKNYIEYVGVWMVKEQIEEFLESFVKIDPTPDPIKYKIVKNNDDVVDEDLTQEQATIFLHTLMKSYVRDSYDLEYYNRGDSLTIFKDGENIYYNLEQE